MDLILRNAVVGETNDRSPVDIGIDNGKIVVIEAGLSADGRELDLGGRMVSPGLVETHIHLDKSCILDRCNSDKGDLDEAIEQVALAKKEFTAEDTHERAKRTLEKCLLHGTTHMRTHLEVDPVIGHRGLDGVLPLIDEYKWAIDLEICVFPQEGLLNNPGTDELMVEAMKRGCKVVGGAPYTDSDPRGQIDRLFEIARDFDADIDMHLDFGATHEELDILYVAELTEKFNYGGRVTVGHVTKLSTMPLDKLDEIAKRLASAGVAVTVLPSTDLFLMGRHMQYNTMRGVVPVHRMLQFGVNCSLSSNNVLNPFTPFGDCSMIRMANLYANICQVGKHSDILECFNMITNRSADILRLDNYGIEVGNDADLVVHDCAEAAVAVSELVPPRYAFKRGRQTFTRESASLHRPW